MKNEILNLQMFADGAAGAAAEGTGAAGAETTTIPVAEGKKNNPLANVKYGKQEEPAEPNGEEPKGQQGANKPNNTTANAGGNEANSDQAARLAEFNRLIKEEYKDLYAEKFQKDFNQRFKEQKDLQKKVSSLDPVLKLLGDKYGVGTDDVDKLVKAITEDSSYYEKEAAERGMTVEQLKEFKRLEAENERFRQTEQQIEEERHAQEIVGKWMQEAESLKATYPGFDFNTEAENPDFFRLLQSGIPVQTAYQVLHQDEIIGGAMQYTAQQVKEATVKNIQSRANRPNENGLSSQASVSIVKKDPSKLTKADREEIAMRVARGETISF